MRPSHILILIIVLIVLFGASKLPEIARNLGRSAKVLKSELQDLSDDNKTAGPVETEKTSEPVKTEKVVEVVKEEPSGAATVKRAVEAIDPEEMAKESAVPKDRASEN